MDYIRSLSSKSLFKILSKLREGTDCALNRFAGAHFTLDRYHGLKAVVTFLTATTRAETYQNICLFGRVDAENL